MCSGFGSLGRDALTTSPKYRYTAALAERDRAPLAGPLGRGARLLDAEPRPACSPRTRAASPNARPLFVLDMFPYPSGNGLHVGHPLGFIATDVYARFQRMNGFNVLHAMGYDAFGLPAEQYAVQTGSTRASRPSRTSRP